MTAQRDTKLAVLEAVVHGLRFGMRAFDDRSEEMSAGPPSGGNSRGGKGGHSDPVFREFETPSVVVTSAFDRKLDRALVAVFDLLGEYDPIALAVSGLPTKGKPACEWCETAARAWRNAAIKAGDEKAAESPVSVHRCDPYLFAKVTDDKGKETRTLVCESCYRFCRREGRAPTNEELWRHAQGGVMLMKPGRRVKMKAAPRLQRTGS